MLKPRVLALLTSLTLALGNTYTATATQNGQTKQVQVDAHTGALIPQ